MRIVFDARCIEATASGTSVYVRELLRRLPLLAPDWSWRILFRNEETRRAVMSDALPESSPNVSTALLPYSFASLLGKGKLSNELIKARCDLYFSPIVANSSLAVLNSLLSLGGFKRLYGASVAAVHVNVERDTKSFVWRRLKRLCHVFATSYCTAIIADSQSLRDDLIRQLSLSEKAASRLKVVYAGVSKAFSPASSPPPPDKAKVILYVGNQRHYKNLDILIRAFATLRRRQEGRLHLLLIGPEGKFSGGLRKLAHNLGLADDVTFAGETTECELAGAYREASLFVCPSSYEGFSLALLGAMASGTPVICCEGGAQGELVGDAAVVVPAGDAEALCNAMARLLADETLRTKAIKAGLARAADFSWDRTAEETLAVFREALDNYKSNAADNGRTAK